MAGVGLGHLFAGRSPVSHHNAEWENLQTVAGVITKGEGAWLQKRPCLVDREAEI